MGSLTSCIKKAGSALHADDKAAILAKARELKAAGASPQDAAMQAVEAQLAVVRAMLDTVAPSAAAAANDEPLPPVAPTEEEKQPESATHDIAEHVTAKGKTIRGVWRDDLTREQAKEIDPYTFQKAGAGWFIREAHIDALPPRGEPIEAAASAPAVERANRLRAENLAEQAEPPLPKANPAIAKLREAGEKLIAEAEGDYGRDRLTNTHKRAAQAASAEKEAAQRIYIGKKMLRIADALEANEAQALAGVTSRAVIEQLDSVRVQAMYAADRAANMSYAEQERRKGRAFEPNDLKFVEYPTPAKWLDGARMQAMEAVKGKRGSKELQDKIRYSSGPDVEVLAGLKAILGSDDAVKRIVGWHAPEMAQRAVRLKRAGIDTTEQLREAIREFDDLKAERVKVDPVKELERKLVGSKVGVDFFPTPKSTAERMVDEAGIKPGMRVLEPSAGNGHIADAIREAGVEPDTVEVSSTLREILEAKKHKLVGSDFLELKNGDYDRIVMNPPFGGGADIDHVRHAYSLLKPGGRIVAIMGEGSFFRSDKKATAFREWLDELGGTEEKLPAGTFTDPRLPATTGVNARIVTIDKPAEPTPAPAAIDARARIKNFSWDAVKLSDHSFDDLNTLREQVEAEHANPGAPGEGYTENGRPTLHLYDKTGRKKLEALSWAVTYKLQDKGRASASAMTHADPGKAPEPASAPVIAESVAKAAKVEQRKPSEMRADLLAQVDKALESAPVAPNDIGTTEPKTVRGKVEFSGVRGDGDDAIVVRVRAGSESKWHVADARLNDFQQSRNQLTILSADGAAAARRSVEQFLLRVRREDGKLAVGEPDMVTFDVPGDGVFKVLNTRERLEEFRAKVERSPGFSDTGQKVALSKPASAASPGPVAALENMIEEGDFHAAADYAAAKKIAIDSVKMTKSARAKFDEWLKSQPKQTAQTDDEMPVASRVTNDTAELRALKAISENDANFALPKSDKTSIQGIVAEVAPNVKVEAHLHEGLSHYVLTMRDGGKATIFVREPSPYGPHSYGSTFNEDNELTAAQTERPGDNPEFVPPETEDVYVNAANLKAAGDGAILYNIAATFAHNTGRIFIGDPAGLSDDAMIRRPEQMLSSALKFGTTAHIAPHPRQVQGDTALGVPPLKWVYGDDLGNIRRLIETNLAVQDAAGPAEITYDPSDGQFHDSAGQVIDRAGIGLLAEAAGGRLGARAGGRTLARGAVLRALLREGGGTVEGAVRERGGLLARLSRVHRVGAVDTGQLFYSRGAADQGSLTAEALRKAIEPIAAAWKNGPTGGVHIVQTADDMPPDMLRSMRSGDPDGVARAWFNPNTESVYLIADKLRSIDEAQAALFHEVYGHYGLRSVLGDRYGAELMQLRRANQQLAAEASMWFAAYGRDEVAARVARGMDRDAAERQVRLLSTEEALADRAGSAAPLKGWDRFVAAVQKALRAVGLDKVADWMENRSEAETLSLLARARDRVREGAASTSAGDETLASRPIAAALKGSINDAAEWRLPAGYMLGDLFKREGTINWWDRTLGTPYNLAQKSPLFKRVFDASQRFIGDVSKFATVAADLAPHLLPKLDGIRDIAKTPISPEDSKAISAPIFEGTLLWTRDADGKPVRVDDLVRRAEDIDSEAKARELMRRGKLDPNVLRMWQGLPIDQFETIVNGKYERDLLQAGLVWSDAELQSQFKLTGPQIALYKEFRSATNKSLTNLAITDMLRYGGKDVETLRDAALAAPDVEAASLLLRDHLFKLAAEDKGRAEILNDTANNIIAKSDRARDLMNRGYAPLSRFGKHTVYVTRGEEQVYYGMFEGAAQANKMARVMRGQYPDAVVKQGTISQEEYKLFAGVSPETVELFGDMLGLEAQGDSESSKAFQLYLKLAKANRSAMKRLITRKGVAGYSEDAARVLAGFVYSNARQSSTNLHMGDMTEAAKDIPQGHGQLKDAALKLLNYIKEPQEEAAGLRGLLFAQYLAGSVAGGLMNASQPFVVTMPYLSQWGGILKAGARLKNAVRDAVRSTTGDKELDAALKRASEDGITSPQEVHQLMAQAQGRASLRSGDGTTVGNTAAKASNTLAKLNLAFGKVFSAAEQFNRKTTFIAAYRTAVEEKISDPDAFARKAVAETQFVYNKGNRPQWARGAIGATLFTFKSYSISYLELLGRMATSGPEGRRATLYAVAILFLMGGADGLPFADDVGDLIDGFLQRLGYNISSKQARQKFFADLLGEDIGRFVSKGVSGLPGAPIDVSGRLGMGNLVPGTGMLVKKADHTGDATEVFGPAGDLAKRSGQAAGQLLDGKPLDAARSISPRFMNNLWQAVDMANTGMYRDQGGKKVVDASGFEAAMKAIGFQPNAVARLQEAARTTEQLKQTYQARKSELSNDMEKAIFNRDDEAKMAVRAAVARWNSDNPSTPILLNMTSITHQVRLMRMDKAQRLEATAPKAIRQEVKRQLSEVAP